MIGQILIEMVHPRGGYDTGETGPVYVSRGQIIRDRDSGAGLFGGPFGQTRGDLGMATSDDIWLPASTLSGHLGPAK